MTVVVSNGRSSPSQEGPQRADLHHALTLSKNAGNANVGREKKLPLADHISWHLPGIAERFAITEQALRRHLFEQIGGIQPYLKVFPSPIGAIPPISPATSKPFTDPTKEAAQAGGVGLTDCNRNEG